MKIFRFVVAAATAGAVALSTAVSAQAAFPAPKPNPPSKATNVMGDATGDGRADIWATIRANRWSASNPRNGATEFYKNMGTTQNFMTYVGDVMNKELGTATAMAPTVDWNGDRRADFLVRKDGMLWLYYNLGDGHLQKGIQVGNNWNGVDQITFAGALNGDSNQYVVARQMSTGNLYAYIMSSGGRLSMVGQVGRGWSQFRFILAPGQFTGDTKADLMAIDNNGIMTCFRGRGGGNISSVGQCGRGWNGFSHALIPGDWDADGDWDLVSIKKLTKPTPYYSPTGGNSAPILEKSPMYVYKNLGGGRWSAPTMIGYDFYQFDVVA